MLYLKSISTLEQGFFGLGDLFRIAADTGSNLLNAGADHVERTGETIGDNFLNSIHHLFCISHPNARRCTRYRNRKRHYDDYDKKWLKWIQTNFLKIWNSQIKSNFKMQLTLLFREDFKIKILHILWHLAN